MTTLAAIGGFVWAHPLLCGLAYTVLVCWIFRLDEEMRGIFWEDVM